MIWLLNRVTNLKKRQKKSQLILKSNIKKEKQPNKKNEYLMTNFKSIMKNGEQQFKT